MRARRIRLCVEAHDEPDFEHLFSYLPPAGLHVRGRLRDRLMSHAVVTTRWLQQGELPPMKTAYVDAVATARDCQGHGHGSTVMRAVAANVTDYDIACLQTSDASAFYERLGWELWQGPLGGEPRRG